MHARSSIHLDSARMKRCRRRRGPGALVAGALLAIALAMAPAANADSLGPITFAAPAYSVGDINGQNQWSNTGSFDARVVATDTRAQSLGLGLQALQISNAKVGVTFAEMPITPRLADQAGESLPINHFEASFSLAASQDTQAPESEGHPLAISVSPSNGLEGRMSYLRFTDLADGIHVYFDEVVDSGPFPTAATFVETDIATLDRAVAHTIRMSIEFKPGPANDVVQVFIDGALVHTGGSWEDYYRYDPEAAVTENAIPTVDSLLFRLGGGTIPADPAAAEHGFLISDLSMSTTASGGSVGPEGKEGRQGPEGKEGRQGVEGKEGPRGSGGGGE